MKNLNTAISITMAQCGHISKDSRNQHHGYDYTSEAEIIAAIRLPMSINGLSIAPIDIEILSFKEGKMHRYDLLITYRLSHISGEFIEVKIPASGADTQDKAFPKALTMGLKYALLQLFMVARGKDPDEDRNIPADLDAARLKEFTMWAEDYGGYLAMFEHCKKNNWPTPDRWDDEKMNSFKEKIMDGTILLSIPDDDL